MKIRSLIRRYGVSSLIHVPIVLSNQPIGVLVFAATGTRSYQQQDVAFAEELSRRAASAIRNAQLFRSADIERERAQEAAELRERLVAIIGHDLRNPLSAISNAAHILSRRELGPGDQKCVRQIRTSTDRMARMIGQILDFARLRAGMPFELKFESADVHQICTAAVDELRLSKPDQRIDLCVDGRGDAICDADRIEQVLSNVIGNAIQHGTGAPIDVSVCDAAPDAVVIGVHNVGPPIPEHAQATIFEAFSRDESSGDRDSKSVGLGLYIAQEIVHAHGGSIAVHSPDRNGTTFTVVLPRAPHVSGARPSAA
jgi:signal transduction histidine kinase